MEFIFKGRKMKDSSEFLTEDAGLFKHLLTPVLLVQEASDSPLQQRKLWWLASHEGQGFIIIHIQFRKNKKKLIQVGSWCTSSARLGIFKCDTGTHKRNPRQKNSAQLRITGPWSGSWILYGLQFLIHFALLITPHRIQ